MSLRIKRDDMVLVLSGKYRGVKGRVLAVMPKDETAVVEGVNMIHKHQKARSQQEPGGIIEKEAPIPLCKLMLAESGGKGRAARFGVSRDDKGNKVRVLKLRGETKEVTV